jgi:hypothetical protein
MLGISEAQYWRSFPYEPYKEELSLSKEIVLTEDIDTEELIKEIEKYTDIIDDDSFFDENFPFIFAPDHLFIK